MRYVPCRFNNLAPCTFNPTGNCEHCKNPIQYGYKYNGKRFEQVFILETARRNRIANIKRGLKALGKELLETINLPGKEEYDRIK
jgi:hypothetical protein